MYRFAELGQLSTALLHELANHLTTITLDIEGLETKKTSMLGRTKRSIRYIDDMVHRVRDQLHGKSLTQHFNVASELGDVVNILQHKASQSQVKLRWQLPADRKGLRCRGDSLRFRQLVANLISNAIEAYAETEASERREVEVLLSDRGKQLLVSINDWGKGIPKPAQNQLFEPFFGTKKHGMGMGLYVSKQIAEEHLNGKLSLDTTKPYTSFKLQLPRVGS
jgi:C4-dicarboxylate-specific signal transduction histidine kinase